MTKKDKVPTSLTKRNSSWKLKFSQCKETKDECNDKVDTYIIEACLQIQLTTTFLYYMLSPFPI